MGEIPPKYCNFEHFFYILGSSNNAPLLIHAKFGTRQYTYGVCWHAKFHLNVFIVSASLWPKTTILGKFWHLRDSCADPLWLMRANFGAQQ